MEEYSDEELKKLGFFDEIKKPEFSLDDIKGNIDKNAKKTQHDRVIDALRDNAELGAIIAEVKREALEGVPKKLEEEKKKGAIPAITVEEINVDEMELADIVRQNAGSKEPPRTTDTRIDTEKSNGRGSDGRESDDDFDR